MFPVIIMDEDKQLPDDNIYYMVGENGLFIRKNLGLIDCVVPVKKISTLRKVEPYAKINIPKIPEKIFAKVVSFFREVYQEYRSEAISLLYYNENSIESKYMIHIPYQKVNGASLSYLRANTMENYNLVCSIHSHSNFGAFHSGTDTDDEKDFDGLHITVGNLENKFVTIATSIAVNGYRVVVNPLNYIQGIDICQGQEEDVENNFYTIGKTKIRYAGIVNNKDKRYIVPYIKHKKAWMEQVEGTKVMHYKFEPENDRDTIYNFTDSIFGNYFQRSNFENNTKRILEDLEEKKKEDENKVCKLCPFGRKESKKKDSKKWEHEEI